MKSDMEKMSFGKKVGCIFLVILFALCASIQDYGIDNLRDYNDYNVAVDE